MKSVILPKGTYYIGDPCYVIEDWDKALKVSDYFEKDGLHLLDDKFFIGFSTKFGDGTYTDTDGIPYHVDSGLIGAVAINLCKDLDSISIDSLGTIHTFDEPTECYEDNGLIAFGCLEIDTGSDHVY
jgi:hypothetical protein